MKRVVLDTNCLLASIYFDVLETIDFPKISVLKLQQFAAMLKM